MNPIDQISKHLTLLGEIGPARTKFTSELNNKISAINTATENLEKMLEQIKELKKSNASSNRNIETVKKGFEEEISVLKEEAKKGESKNQETLQDIANKLSEYTNTLNEVKNATDNVDLTKLEENIRQLQEALGATVELPTQKSMGPNTKSGWSALRDNIKDANAGTTGLPGSDEGLPQDWASAVSEAEGSRGQTYYYRNDNPEGTRTWTKPTSGGRRKSRRNINMRRKGGRRTRRRRRHRRTGGFRYDMSPQEQKRSRTLRSVKSLRSKSIKKSRSKSRTKSRNVGRGAKGKKTKRRRKKRRKR
uniref:Uncharacterized protein n=1 Tax=viral metagenome TaxID=1070528 RepID=A0A6C0C322_9ZZZZ